MRALLVVTGVVLAIAPPIEARPLQNVGGAAQLHYELSSIHDIDHEPGAPPSSRDLVLAGARLHGVVGGRTLGYHVGLDLAAGATVRAGGFAYDVSLFPIGAALRFAATSFVSVGAGIGASGAIGTLDDALTLPVELRFEVGRGVRLLGRLRTTWIAASPGRQSGTTSAPIGDELEAMLAVRLGLGYRDFGFPTGNGYFVGIAARELLDARFVGVTIGYSIDMGTPREPER